MRYSFSNFSPVLEVNRKGMRWGLALIEVEHLKEYKVFCQSRVGFSILELVVILYSQCHFKHNFLKNIGKSLTNYYSNRTKAQSQANKFRLPVHSGRVTVGDAVLSI